ncbi:chaperonin 10-like protein [Kockiozyma suomiensis]|uniref:chaperonin 10-like protein n=1 Tax=Kockiozyma suomiensis TaxID=1337062 RepID=UPI003343DFDB
MSSITASVLVGPKELVLETRSLCAPGPDECQVAVKSTTLCGSDLHYYNHFANGDFKVRESLSLGHESAGEVIAVGANVTDLKPGDRVALEVGISCLECDLCRRGKYNLCSKMQFRSSAKSFPHFQGTLQEKINHPASLCHKIPSSISYNAAALIEPLSVAIHSSRRSGVTAGDKVLVFGAGAVGLFCAAMAAVSGASTIAIADISPGRVDFAVSQGFATHGYVVPLGPRPTTTEDKLESARSIADELTALKMSADDDETFGSFDIAFECTGVESCIQASIYAAKAGGKVMFVGMGSPIQTLHIGAAMTREVDLLGVFRYANAYPTAISLLRQKKIPAFESLVTHKFSGLQNVHAAFEVAGKTSDGDGKLVIKTVINF